MIKYTSDFTLDVIKSYKRCYYDFKNFKLPIPDEVNVKEIDVAGQFLDILAPEVLCNTPIVYTEGPYEYSNVKLCKGDVVVDAGANIGLFSAVAGAKGCVVHSFEPDNRCFGYIEGIINLNPSFNITIHPIALSDRLGESVIYKHPHYHTGTTLDERMARCQRDLVQSGKVKVSTLDKALSGINKLDFIKADIEGHENNMLLGAKDLIKFFKPKLSICSYHHGDDPQVLESTIKDICGEYNVVHKYKKIYAWV